MRRPAGHIVFVVPDFTPATGGTATQTRLEAAELTRRGWRVDVLTRRPTRDRSRREVIDGVGVRRLGPDSTDPVRHLLAVAGVWLALLTRYRHADVVQVVMDADSAVASVLAGHGSRTTLMWATAGDPAKVLTGRLAALRRRGLRPCRHVVLTPPMAEELVTTLGQGPHAVIPVPVDPERFAPPTAERRRTARAGLGIADAATVIAFSGHLEHRKGVDLLVDAFVSLAAGHRDLHLLLIGSGIGRVEGCEEQLRERVSDEGLTDRVHFAGAVPDVAPLLAAADVFCLPSRREGMPNSLLEAMAAGIACVAPPSAGGEVLLGGGAGVVPPTNRVPDLADALLQLVEDPASRTSLAERARRRALSEHSPGAVVDAYEQTWGMADPEARPPFAG